MLDHKPALLIIGHGSRDMEGVDEFQRLAAHMRARYPNRPSAIGFLEFARPLISDGIDTLIAQGVTRITAIPGMLMAAKHAKNDIPFELNTLQSESHNIKITYGAELGVDSRLLRTAAERIASVEHHFGETYQRNDTLLIVVGRGSSDPDANANIAKITRMLWEGMGFGWSETCFVGITRPLLEETLHRSRGLGFKQIIVFPYFLFTGRLVKKIVQLTNAFQAANSDLNIINAPYLNDHELVIDALCQRVTDAEEGNGNMNCQLCQYREQIIGFEQHVGEPQVGHHLHVRGAGTDHSHPHSTVHHQHTHTPKNGNG